MTGHKKQHQDEHHEGGADEIEEASLLPQIPIAHQGTHLAGGTDAIDGLNANQVADGSVSNEQYQLLGALSESPIADHEYVDGKIQGLDWQESVIERRADPPGDPDAGDRYLVIEPATGDWDGWEDSIVEWDGSEWSRIEPDIGFATMVEDTGVLWTYNGTDWVKFGSAISHGALSGLGEDDHTHYLLANGTRDLSGHLLPDADDNIDLGSTTRHFREINAYTLKCVGGLAVAATGNEPVLAIGATGTVSDRVVITTNIGDLELTPGGNIQLESDTILDTDVNLDATGGRILPKIISQTSEPALSTGEIAIWIDTTVGEEARWILLNIGGDQYKVEVA